MIRVLSVAQLEPGHHWLGEDRGRVRTVEDRGAFIRITFDGRPETWDHPRHEEAVVRVLPTTTGSHP